MRRLWGAIGIIAIVAGVALGTVFVLGTASTGGCPTALLEGTLAMQDGSGALVVIRADAGPVRVRWPIGYGVGGGGNGELVLTRLFQQVARPGDHVAMAGADGGDHFNACGVVEVTAQPPNPEPQPIPPAGTGGPEG